LQLHLDLGSRAAFGRRQNGGQRRQLHPAIAAQRCNLAGLRGRVALAVGQQIEAHGLAQLERKAPAREHHAHALFRATRQQAQALRSLALLARQQQPVAARRTAANARHHGFDRFRSLPSRCFRRLGAAI
jgi:hypothetical protein